jgi:hypothetical protein
MQASDSKKSRFLFILKQRVDYDAVLHAARGLSTGLFNSASYAVEALRDLGHDTDIAVAVDNNDIDRLVTEHQATHVILEALWVVPQKFTVLTKLHPKVKWIVRLHSDMPFIANEGMAMDWIPDLLRFTSVTVAPNSPRLTKQLAQMMSHMGRDCADRVVLLPNIYPSDTFPAKIKPQNRWWIDISCFGAIRPMKNQLMQAVAAVEFAAGIGKQLRFHINSGRVEGRGEAVQRNITNLFAHLADSGHPWMPRDEFVDICANMDIAMQVSFSETFNIVAADHVTRSVPLVSSAEVPWSHAWWQADPTDSDSMVLALQRAYQHPRLNIWANQFGLAKYRRQALKKWSRYLRSI